MVSKIYASNCIANVNDDPVALINKAVNDIFQFQPYFVPKDTNLHHHNEMPSMSHHHGMPPLICNTDKFE